MARPAISANLIRGLALATLIITVAGFVVIVAGLAELQKTTNHLGSDLPAETVTAYTDVFNQALLQPYPANHHFQFSYIWFIIFGQLFTVLFCAAILAVPLFHPGRGAALAFLAIFCTLTINVVQNLVFLHRSATAQTVYSKKHINVTLAGAFLVVFGNVATIFTLGFWEPFRADIPAYYGTNKAAVPATTTPAQAHTTV